MSTRIIALIGVSGSGKTALIHEAVLRNSTLQKVRSFTTRSRRNPTSDATYDFVSVWTLIALWIRQRIVQWNVYGWNIYGNERRHFEAIGCSHIGILAMTERGALKLRKAGYDVRIVKLTPRGATVRRGREAADRKRLDRLIADYEIINDFGAGGFDHALRDLIRWSGTAFT